MSPAPHIVAMVEAFKASPSPALFFEVFEACALAGASDYFRREVGPAMRFDFPKRRGRKRITTTDGKLSRLSVAVKAVLAMAANGITISQAAEACAREHRFDAHTLARAAYGDNVRVRRELPEIFADK